MGVGQKGLGAVAGPLHRTADLLGGPQRHHLLGVDEDFRAEAAADVGRHHAQLVLLRDVVERRQHEAGDMRVLRRRVERKVLFGSLYSAIAARGSIAFGTRRLLVMSSETTLAADLKAASVAASSPMVQS
jgi:hypothetical protein